jgi:hypothetical protein
MSLKTICLYLVVIILGISAAGSWLKNSSTAQSPTERIIEDKIPKDVPIKIKLKQDKESRVKALDNQGWLRDLQLELTNTSTKPIYYVSLWVALPDVLSPDGIRFVLPVRYGRVEFIKAETRPNKDDVPILPGKTVTVQVASDMAKGWEIRIAAGTVHQPRKLEFEFVHLSFGDGSGFNGAGQAFPYQRTSSRCRKPDKPTFSLYSTLNKPAFVPVSFFTPYRFGFRPRA